MRKFLMTIETDVEIELADAVIDAVDDAWREELYDIEGAEHMMGMLIPNVWTKPLGHVGRYNKDVERRQ